MEIMTLWGGAVAEELVMAGSEGLQADLLDAKDRLVYTYWLGTAEPESEEGRAYLEWLRLRTKNGFQKRHWQAVLPALTEALLEGETIEYETAKRVIEDTIEAQPNLALSRAKEK